MTKEHSVTGSTTDHRQHGEPHVCQALRREAPVTNAQHVRHGFEHGPGVLLEPVRFLFQNEINSEFSYTIKCFIK